MNKEENSQYRTIEQIMQAREKSAMEAAKEVDMEIAIESRQSKEQIELEMLADVENAKRRKAQFINEIKNGLGEQIKEAPNKVTFLKKKKSLMDRIKDLFKRF